MKVFHLKFSNVNAIVTKLISNKIKIGDYLISIEDYENITREKFDIIKYPRIQNGKTIYSMALVLKYLKITDNINANINEIYYKNIKIIKIIEEVSSSSSSLSSSSISESSSSLSSVSSYSSDLSSESSDLSSESSSEQIVLGNNMSFESDLSPYWEFSPFGINPELPRSTTYARTGSYSMAGTNNIAYKGPFQDISISDYASEIDTGVATCDAKMWVLKSFTSTTANGSLSIKFYDDEMSLIESYYDNYIPSSQLTWEEFILLDSQSVPIGTRTIRVEINADSEITTDIYIDDVEIKLNH